MDRVRQMGREAADDALRHGVLDALREAIAEARAEKLVVGMPYNMNGTESEQIREVMLIELNTLQRRNKLGDGLATMQYYKEKSVVKHGADTREVAIGYQDKIICGKFVDRERPTYSQNLKVNSTCLFYHLLVIFAEFFHLIQTYKAIRYICILFFNVNMVEKILIHKVTITLRMLGGETKIFIKIKTKYIFRIKTLLIPY